MIKPRSASIVADMNTLAPVDLVNALVGMGPNAPTVSNIVYSGDPLSAGLFTDMTDVFGFPGGIVLSSGDISNIVGPNLLDNATYDAGLPGDPDLDALIPGYTTYDATYLQFDFECIYLQEISFRYLGRSNHFRLWIFSKYSHLMMQHK